MMTIANSNECSIQTELQSILNGNPVIILYVASLFIIHTNPMLWLSL